MTSESGFVYILLNPSMDGTFLKIGMTTRTPTERAIELSRETGIALPFVVAYEQRVVDAKKAENMIHNALAVYRINRDREFFKLPLAQAVRVVESIAVDVGIGNADVLPSTNPRGVNVNSPRFLLWSKEQYAVSGESQPRSNVYIRVPLGVDKWRRNVFWNLYPDYMAKIDEDKFYFNFLCDDGERRTAEASSAGSRFLPTAWATISYALKREGHGAAIRTAVFIHGRLVNETNQEVYPSEPDMMIPIPVTSKLGIPVNTTDSQLYNSISSLTDELEKKSRHCDDLTVVFGLNYDINIHCFNEPVILLVDL